jgi:hypothetical protein
MEWVDQYPSGIMTVGDAGDISLPAKTSKQTANQTAMSRATALIKTGSTHKLPPLNFSGVSTNTGLGPPPVIPAGGSEGSGGSGAGGSGAGGSGAGGSTESFVGSTGNVWSDRRDVFTFVLLVLLTLIAVKWFKGTA